MTSWQLDGDAVCSAIADNSVGSGEVEDESLTGADVKLLSRADYASTSGATVSRTVSVGPGGVGEEQCNFFSQSAPGVSVGDLGLVTMEPTAPVTLQVRNQIQSTAGLLQWTVCTTDGSHVLNFPVNFYLMALR